jgi:large subunit ribosomal protein L30e
MIDVNKAIGTAVKTGKVILGVRKAVESAKVGRAKLIVVATNCPRKNMEEIIYYGKLSGVPVSIYKGTSIDLGAICGKPYVVSALTIREPGDSDILRLRDKTKPELVNDNPKLEETNA